MLAPDGLEIFRQLRAKRRPAVIVLLTSGMDDAQIIEAIRLSAADRLAPRRTDIAV